MKHKYSRIALETGKERKADAEASQKTADQLAKQFDDASKQGDGMKVAIDPKKIEGMIDNVPKDEKVPAFKPMGPADDLEVDIGLADQENQRELDKSGELKASVEALFIVQESLTANLRNKTCTKDSIAFARHIVNQELSKARLVLPRRAMESTVSLEEQHRIVLESIDGALSRIGQALVMNYKHAFNATADLFKSIGSQISKYEGEIASAEKEYASVKSSWKNQTHKGSLTSLWYFFATERGQANNLIEATKHDLEMSTYVLGAYPKIVLAQMKGLQNTLRSARPRNTADVGKVFTNIEKLKHPGAMFDKKFLGNYSYFNVTGLEQKAGKVSSPVTFAGKTYAGIAALASPIVITERSKVSHKISKAISSTGDAVSQAMAGASLAYSTEDIGKMIAFGKEYIENVKDMLAMGAEMNTVSKGWADSLDGFFMSETGEMDPADLKAHTRICMQIAQYGENLTRCFTSPMTAECARSLRGAKYISYVVKRMVHDAS